MVIPDMKQDGFFTSLSDSDTVRLILELHARGELILKDLRKIIVTPQTLRMRVDLMEEEGIVAVRIVFESHKLVKIALTDMGKDIGLLLSMVDSLIPGDIADKSINMRYADPILRLLRKKEYTVQKEIGEVMPYYNSYVKVLAKMEEDGLVSIVKTTEGRREIRYSLTPKGERIADVFEAIYQKIVPRQ